MRSLLPLILYCISLVSLRPLLTLAHGESPDENRLDLLTDQGGDEPLESEAAFLRPASGEPSKRLTAQPGHPPVPPSLARALERALERARARPDRPLRGSPPPTLAWARPADARAHGRSPRLRRHAPARGGHYSHSPQLMRVGCVLGTCQVQNLSHRLYQLIGQSGKVDSSPINPRSPHSYG